MIKIIWFTLIYCILTLEATSQAYDFPVRPGSEQWKQFTTHLQMEEACSLPQEYLEQVSNEDLLATCLDYPLLIDITLFNNTVHGWKTVKSRFNGLQSLTSRKGVTEVILKYYSALDPDYIETAKDVNQKGKLIMRNFYLELLLGDGDLVAGMTLEEAKETVKQLINKYSDNRNAQYFGNAGVVGFSYAAGSILNTKYAVKTHADLNSFLDNPGNISQELANDIRKAAYDFVNK